MLTDHTILDFIDKKKPLGRLIFELEFYAQRFYDERLHLRLKFGRKRANTSPWRGATATGRSREYGHVRVMQWHGARRSSSRVTRTLAPFYTVCAASPILCTHTYTVITIFPSHVCDSRSSNRCSLLFFSEPKRSTVTITYTQHRRCTRSVQGVDESPSSDVALPGVGFAEKPTEPSSARVSINFRSHTDGPVQGDPSISPTDTSAFKEVPGP